MDERRIKRLFHGLRFTPLHPQWLVFRHDESIRRWLVEQAGGAVLDVGCADGVMRRYLPAGCDYTGLDYPGTAIDWYGTRPTVFGDAARLPFSHECFDTVLLLDVLEHLPEPRRALAEAWRVLRPGGILAVKVPCLYPVHDAPLDFRRWTPFGIARELSDSGFEVVATRNLGTPFETAMLLANLGQAKALLDGVRRRQFPATILHGATLPWLVPLRNLLAWLVAAASGNTQTMPFAICALARKTQA